MKVSELLKIARGLTVQDDYNGDCNIGFDGWIVLKPKAKREFETALNLEWRFNGSETAIVECFSDEEVDAVRYLFDCIDGEPLTKDEWNALFREPSDKEWEKFMKRTGTYYKED